MLNFLGNGKTKIPSNENTNFVRNIKQAKDVEELKEVLVKIVRRLNDYLEEVHYS